MEKRVLIAALISVLFLSWYSQMLTKIYGSPASRTSLGRSQQTAGSPTTAIQGQKSATYPIEKEEVLSISSEDLELEIGKSSGAVRKATLKRFMDSSKKHPLQISSGLELIHLQIGEAPLKWRLIEEFQSHAKFEATVPDGSSYHILYSLESNNIFIELMLQHESLKGGELKNDLLITSAWSKADELNRRYNPLEALFVADNGNNNPSYKRFMAPVRQERDVPRGTLLVSLSERYFCHLIRMEQSQARCKLIPSSENTIVVESRVSIPATNKPSEQLQRVVTIYLGSRDYFQLTKAGFKQAFPLGTFGQIGLILLSALRFIAGVTKNYGVAILLFSAAITFMMSPFTILSVRSMKKMQKLKPQIDKIMAQHKNDSTAANKEIFALYKEHKVSPLSGCLPMFLQMPIFIALFRAISHFIELRGQPFLWIKDLSLPDRLAQLPLSLPILGTDLNALPIIMASAMYFQTKMSQVKTVQDNQDPTAKMMSGPTMSIIFGIMFYQFPSGLVLYWLTNSLMSMLWMRAAKSGTSDLPAAA